MEKKKPFAFLAFFFLALITSPAAHAQSWSLMESGTTQDLYDIWGTSMSNIFAVGDCGTILHYDGNSWTDMDSGITGDLISVNGRSDTAFAVSSDISVLEYDGNSWSLKNYPRPQKALTSVWCTGMTSFFSVGQGGSIEKTVTQFWPPFIRWTFMDSPTQNDLVQLWGNTDKSLFAVGASGTILHYAGPGTAWTLMDSGISNDLHGIWGNSDFVLAVGTGGVILRSSGSSWSIMSSGTDADLFDVWYEYIPHAYAVGAGGTILHYDGSHWSSMPSGTTHELVRVWGLTVSDYFAVGKNGTILHYHDTSTTTTQDYGPSTSTSIISGGTSTTSSPVATSTIPAQKCPFSSLREKNISSIRELRNRRLHTGFGALLAGMYYKNMAEIGAVLQNDPGLHARFSQVVSRNLPAVNRLIQQGAAEAARGDLMDACDFLLCLQQQAGPMLSMDIDFILRGLESGWLAEWLGISIIEH